MAKPKGKSRAAAATASASNVEGASGNNMTIADPAPSSEPVEEISGETAMENAAVPDDKSEGAADNNKEKGTENDGVDEPEEIDEEEEGDQEEGEETQDDLDAKLEEEANDVEEAKDGLDDKSEEDNNDEGDEMEEDAKEDDGVVEPVGTDIVPEGSKIVDNDVKVLSEAKVAEDKDDKKDDVKEEGTTKKKPKRIIKKKTTAASVTPAAVGTDIVPEGSKMVDNDGKGLSEAKADEEKDDKRDDAKEEEGTTNKKLKIIRRKKKTAAASAAAPAAVSNDASKKQDNANKQGAAAAEKKGLKMADGMGLVFMCSAKTKQDCYRYKVLGLPASKKEIVAKIYKGMRLFLFDTDLKLMYGIYRAASPGGFNIEPKAFKSAFPAQVRFEVLNDCLPLPEEKFKEAIKENYYKRNKFDCQLSPQQVKKLCRLFQKAGKITEKRISREGIAQPELPPPARGRQKTRKPIRYGPEHTSSARGRLKNREVVRAEPERTSFAHGRKRPREVARAEPPEQISSHGRKRPHHERERGRRDERYASPRGGDRLYALPPPVQARAYGRQGDEYYYRRDPPPPPPPQPLDPRDYRRDLPREYHRAVEVEARPRQPVEYRDAYSSMYREPVPYSNTLYTAPASYAAPPAPPAYAPNPASLAPSAYAPSSSLYYRY